MYFVRSGYILLPHGSLRNAGASGYFWSSVAYPADVRGAFNLDFNSTSATPSNINPRYIGFPLQHHKHWPVARQAF